MGQVSIVVPGPGTYQVQCDPSLAPLAQGGTAADVLAGKQFYNDQNKPVTGTMPNNPPQAVELSGGESYTIPRGYHDGTGKVMGTGTVLPTLSSPAETSDILSGKQAIDQDGALLTGTMPNNGAVSAELTAGGSYTIPAGYHNGQGTVTSTAQPLPTLTSPAAPSDILSGKEAIDQTGEKVTGTMPQKSAADVTASGADVTVPAGYYPQPVTKGVATATQATPEITVSSGGLITASATQGGGYVASGTKNTTQQLDPQPAQTITPGTADQTISAGKYLTGAQTITGDANLKAENIKSGVSLFGVDGTYQGTDTSDATATASDILSGKTAYVNGVKIVGTMMRLGVDWVETTLPFSGNWQDVAYGGGKFVAVPYLSSSNKVAYSNDGITWVGTTLPTSGYWSKVAYGGGKFVVITANSNKVAYSNDGITWVGTTLPTSGYWSNVAYGGGKFVVITDNSNKVAYSNDGITWVGTTLPFSGEWEPLAYGGGKFVTILSGSNKAIYSEDGITWVETTLPISGDWWSATYGGGKFVVTPINSSDKAVCSEDGINWVETTLPFSGNWKDVAYGGGKFVTMAYNYQDRSDGVAYSEDGINWVWTTSLPVSVKNGFGMAYGKGKFVVVIYNGRKAAYSSADGLVA